MKRTILSLLFSALNASAVIAVLEWDRNSEPNVAGYRVYSGTAPRSYAAVIDVGDVTAQTNDYALGTHFLAVTAYDTDGLESEFSEELTLLIVEAPVLRFESNTLAWTGSGAWRVRWLTETSTNVQIFSINRVALGLFPSDSVLEVQRYELGATNVLSDWSVPLRYHPPAAPRTLQIRVSLQRTEALNQPFTEFAQAVFHDAAGQQAFYRAELQLTPTGVRIR